ncbi:hypothetical protein CNEO3_830003 [Clostridium neonatale]|nr:hypothetical protein CNEO3_830003 [Clostridium neonatale]
MLILTYLYIVLAQMLLQYLNTSHVNLNREIVAQTAAVLTFKYISC